MTFATASAIFATFAFIGRLLDAAVARLYTPHIRRWLCDKSLALDDVRYWDIVHSSPGRAQRIHEWLAGRHWFSWQNLVAVVLSFVSAFLFFGLMLSGEISVALGEHLTTPKELLKQMLVVYPIFWLAVFSLLVICIWLSWTCARVLHRRVQPRLRNMIWWYLLSLGFVLLAAPVPYAGAAFIFFGVIRGEPVLDALSYALTLYFVPYLLLLTAAVVADENSSIWGALAVGLILPPTFPAVLQIVLLLWDIALKPVVRPVSVFASGLLEHIHQEKYPLTWILTTLGAVPGLVKLWIDAMKP